MKKFFGISILSGILMLTLISAVASAAPYDEIIRKWTRQETYKDDFQAELTIKVTYYASEYIDALIQKEAEKNLWTKDEMENYQYQLLKSLSLEEYVPFYIEFDNRGPAMHMAPFNEQITLWVGKKQYKPVDYEKRFNFALTGKRGGFVYFPRYDEKGKPILEGVKTIRLVINGGISAQTIGKTIEFYWDIDKDSGGAYLAGKAAERLEADRLIKRLEKLNDQKKELQKQLDELDKEIQKIEERLKELQN
ncbi:hypothetical protein Tlie_0574 [Thermovirga lienii DSM 17291]|uniref:Uncharacterized protein n=1 Tax=Thermovirga lienii (strain ATCC BAA-1197 / DSM 17291 / Cas60314) TaxID=580340 RepID=G7V8E7_THELD|nr:hypothetical protein [Thermovirga lienii]AER66309.1 hypothetical protein Tlie_0574 [Thermovirga lienii DSM 17291]